MYGRGEITKEEYESLAGQLGGGPSWLQRFKDKASKKLGAFNKDLATLQATGGQSFAPEVVEKEKESFSADGHVYVSVLQAKGLQASTLIHPSPSSLTLLLSFTHPSSPTLLLSFNHPPLLSLCFSHSPIPLFSHSPSLIQPCSSFLTLLLSFTHLPLLSLSSSHSTMFLFSQLSFSPSPISLFSHSPPLIQ
jgi:hypothetical protein